MKQVEDFMWSEEFFSEALKEEILPLLTQHKEEIAHYSDIKLNPNWAFYKQAQENKLLRIYTMRDQDKALVGYNIFFVNFNPHYVDSLQAKNDIVYLRPDLRAGRLGLKFIGWCDERLKAEGVQVVYHHVKKVHNFGPALEKMFGYELIDLIYGRRLDK